MAGKALLALLALAYVALLMWLAGLAVVGLQEMLCGA